MVLTPTAELAKQVLRVSRALSRAGLPLRTVAFSGDRAYSTQIDVLKEGVDLLVATPGRFLEHYKSGNLSLDHCKALVYDEADVLLGDQAAFAEEVLPIKGLCPEATQFVFVTATMPEHVFQDIEAYFAGIVGALGPGLHRTSPGLTETVVDCSGGDEVSEETGFLRKTAGLMSVLQEHKASRTIVFCNKIETCRKVENFLNRRTDEIEASCRPGGSICCHSSCSGCIVPRAALGPSAGTRVEVIPLHGAIRDQLREANLKSFLVPPAAEGTDHKILITTDR